MSKMVFHISPSGKQTYLFGWLVNAAPRTEWLTNHTKYLKRKGVLVFHIADDLVEECFPNHSVMTSAEQIKTYGRVVAVSSSELTIMTTKR